MKENISKIEISIDDKKESVNLIDIPGHPKARVSLLEKYLKKTKKIIFMVDCSEFQVKSNETQVAEFDLKKFNLKKFNLKKFNLKKFNLKKKKDFYMKFYQIKILLD